MRLINRNPAMNRMLKKAEKGTLEAVEPNNVATVRGSMLKSAFLCVVVILTAVLTVVLLANFIQNNIGSEEAIIEMLVTLLIAMAVAGIAMFVISLIIMFAPKTASVLGTVYCLLNGFLLGLITLAVDMYYPGISFLALLGTCVVFLVSLTVFRLLGSRVSGKFVKYVLIALFSLIIVEILGAILSAFVPAFANLFNSFGLQMAISVLSIIIASLIIIVNLNTMYRMEEYRIDKKFEWLAAFSLTVTLIWVYMEILEILLRVLSRSRK